MYFKDLWVDKYAPSSISEYICNESMKNDLLQYVETQSIPNIVLSSSAGYGKTSLAKLLVKELNAEYMYLNSSLNNSIDDVREKIITFASTYSMSSNKIVILDEADGMSVNALNSLKGVIEQYSETTRFIFTTNHLDKIPDPILSRCIIYELGNADKQQIGKRCVSILKAENISFTKEELVNVIKFYYPDIRKIMHSLQLCSSTGELIFDESKVSKDYFFDVINHILDKGLSDEEKFIKVRQLFIDNQGKNIDIFYSLMYKNLDRLAPNKRCDVTIILDEYLYKSVTIPDKEINLMACVSSIINILK